MRRLLMVSPLQRRLVVIPCLFVSTGLALLASPLLLLVAVITDLFTAPRRMRLSRVLIFGLYYVLLECAMVLLGGALWVATGFGLFLRSRASMQVHAAAERWWVTTVMTATQRWMGVEVQIEGLDSVRHGPIVVVAQHASFFDAVLPAVLLAWAGSDATPRYTLKQELLLLPIFDIFGNRLPNHFVDRSPVVRSVELQWFGDLAENLGRDAVVVFPEGTFHTPERAERARARMARSDPERAERVSSLSHVLPLKPGGVSAVLDRAPHADLVMVGHNGFQPFGSIRAILANVPFREPVRVRIWRFDADEVPKGPDERLRFLDDRWSALDSWITGTVPDDGRSTG